MQINALELVYVPVTEVPHLLARTSKTGAEQMEERAQVS
jgi:hypothetical protein